MFATSTLHLNERSDLSRHLQQCSFARGRLHGLRCAVEAFDAQVAPRFVTTLGAVTLLMLVVTLLS